MHCRVRVSEQAPGRDQKPTPHTVRSVVFMPRTLKLKHWKVTHGLVAVARITADKRKEILRERNYFGVTRELYPLRRCALITRARTLHYRGYLCIKIRAIKFLFCVGERNTITVKSAIKFHDICTL